MNGQSGAGGGGGGGRAKKAIVRHNSMVGTIEVYDGPSRGVSLAWLVKTKVVTPG